MVRDRSPRRGLWISLGVATAALALVVGLIFWTLNPASLRPRLEAAVQRATGRQLTIGGMGVGLSLVPTITLGDVSLSNPPGFSRPEMMKIARVELSVGLVPLLRHRVEIDHITLVRPEVLLERDAAGHPNWSFRHADAGAAAAVSQPGPAAPKERFATSLNNVVIEDGRAGWLDAASGRHYEAEIPRLTLAAPDGRPVQGNGSVVFGGQTFALSAEGGSLENLEPSEGAAWPVAVKLEAGGTRIAIDGRIAHPLRGSGYRFSIDGSVPEPEQFAALLPDLPLASLHAVTAQADVSDGDAGAPGLTALTVKAGSATLSGLAHGVRLDDVTLSGKVNDPIKVTARLILGDTESGITGTAGDLSWLTGGGPGPLSLDLLWNAASARGSVTGTIQDPKRLEGFALDVALNVPKPFLVWDGAPPALRAVSLRARLTDAPGPVPFQFTSNAGDLAGDLTISRDPRVSVSGTVSSRRLDLDLLRPVAAASLPAPAASPNAAPADASPSGPAPAGTVIPDTKLPFGLIRGADADVAFNLDLVRFSGADIAGIKAHLAMKDGVLRVDPFTAGAPGQPFAAMLEIDAAAASPSVRLSLDAPGVPLALVLAAFGLPPAATGTLEARADLTGTGDSPHAIAATLDGHAGLAVQDGQLDARLVNTWLERLRPLRIDGANTTELKCFAVRADAKSGVVTIDPFALDTAALIVEGSGDVDLGAETMALRLRPRAKIGGTGFALPLRIGGSLRDPSARVDLSPSGIGGKGLAGLLLGGKDIMGAAGGGDPCPQALTKARDGVTALPAPAGGSRE